jgi:alkyldihydroxyacetonephosphate synthase
MLIAISDNGVLGAPSGGRDLGPAPAEHWLAHRYDGAFQLANVLKSDGLLGPNAIADTMEIAGPWSRLDGLYHAVRDAMTPHCVAVLCHASHVYPDGACLYFTMAMQAGDEAGAEARYHETWEAGMEACLAAGGTITHHHGVGRLKARWLRRELGEGGWALLEAVKGALDPKRILNPGNLGLR